MSGRDLYKMIENLNHKIKKLDNQIKNKNFNIIPNTKNNSNTSIFRAYGIIYPKSYDKNKRYIGLLFDENFNDFTSENNEDVKNKLPFIKLSNSNNIINYSVNIEIDDNTPNQQIGLIGSIGSIGSIALGIKDKVTSKVRIIKGSKIIFELNNKTLINNKMTINNTILYSSQSNEELCMIVELGPKCKIISSKSLIKILSL